MKFIINKRFTSVEAYEAMPELLKKFKANKAIFDDMKTCISGITRLEGREIFGVYSDGVELKSIEFYGLTGGRVSFTLYAQIRGWLSTKDERVRDFIAELSVYGEVTDNGEYFAWDECDATGIPTKLRSKVYIEA